MPPQILVVGGLTLDMTFALREWPQPNSAVHTDSARIEPGGKGLNQAVAARRLGADAALVGCVGRDFAGDFIVETLQQEGIAADFVCRHPTAATTLVTILVHNQQPGFISRPGASKWVQAETVREAVSGLPPDSIVLVNYEVTEEVMASALQTARAAGLTTILNPAPLGGPLMNSDHLALADYVIPNLGEGRLLVGDKSAPPEDIVRSLLAQGTGAVCLTLGEDGCLFARQEPSSEIIRQPTFRIEAVDTTGASDAFCGAFAVAVAEQRPVRDALRFASAAAALACTVTGGMPAMPQRAAVDGLLTRRRIED
ncbi:MAG: ribokinase [Anaerolineaceae bacterium]|nr:ribokinase [Anaerolineaceae bacterium]